MRGSTLKEVLDGQGVSVSELARRLEISPQTLYSMIKRDSQKVDFDLMLRICRELDVPMERFSEDAETPDMPDIREWDLVRRYRRLDEPGRYVADVVIDAELGRVSDSKPQVSGEDKIIPLYSTPAAAGYASPAFGDDYTDYKVPSGNRADFAVKIDGDSMEPYLSDGSVALCKRGEIIRDGDVGLFFVDGDMKCKQYCRDYSGDVHLFSLNRRRADADVHLHSTGSVSLMCFGKVLMDKKVPLPL